MNFDQYKNQLNIVVRYGDLDTYRHVNNKAFVSYLEDARIYYMKEVMQFTPKNMDYEVVVGRIDISYLAPLFLYDDVWVYTRCSNIGNKSYELESIIIKMVDNKRIVAAKALVTMVSYDLEKGVTKKNSEKMISLIKEYEELS